MAHVHALSICLPWIRHEAGDVDGQAIDPILDVRSCVQDHHLELPPTGRPVPGSDTVSQSFQGPHIQTGFSAGSVVKADRNLGATRSHAVLNYSCRMQASMVCNVGPPSNAENMTAKRWSKPLWV